jgi:hypothetical protein
VRNWRHRIRVHFAEGPPRDIMSQTAAGAMRTARAVERMFGGKGPRCTPVKAEDLGHLGTDQDTCPVCSRRFSLFDTIPAEGQS